jgi:hypothetical protein
MASPNIVQLIATWANSRAAIIQRAYDQKGGWEGWAQVEIALSLQDELSKKPDFLDVLTREFPFYANDSLRADIAILYLPDGMPIDIIELKCESAFQTKQFAAELYDDFVKVTTENISHLKNCHPSRQFLIGIACTHEARDEALANIKKKAGVVLNVIGFAGEMSILWLQKDGA